jgi:serine/threonine-protein kinase
VRRAITAVLPTIGCAWLDVDTVAEDAGGVVVRMKGVAGDVVKAQAAVEAAARTAGTPIKDIGFDVSPLKDRRICSRLDAFNAIRADPAQGARLTTAQTSYELRTSPDNPVATAHPVVTVAPGDPALGFVVAGLDSDGALAPVVTREQLPDLLRNAPQNVAKIGADSYRLGGDVTGTQDWFGTLLLTGKGPFDPKLLTLKSGESGADWTRRFASAAAAGGWKAEMVWYKVVKPAG